MVRPGDGFSEPTADEEASAAQPQGIELCQQSE